MTRARFKVYGISSELTRGFSSEEREIELEMFLNHYYKYNGTRDERLSQFIVEEVELDK
jgi:hypothetical protein